MLLAWLDVQARQGLKLGVSQTFRQAHAAYPYLSITNIAALLDQKASKQQLLRIPQSVLGPEASGDSQSESSPSKPPNSNLGQMLQHPCEGVLQGGSES